MITRKVKKPKRKTPVWTLERDGITYSALSTWLRCPELFRLQYVEGWSSKAFSEALEWGNLFHYINEHIDQSKDVVDEVTRLSRKYQRKHWPKKDRPSLDEKEQYLIERTFIGVETVYPEYYRYWKDQDIKWIEREHVFRTTYRVPHIDHTQNGQQQKHNGELEVSLTGMMDGLFQKGRGKHPWLFETKTKGRIDELGLQASLTCDMQTMLYSTGASLTLEKPVVGVLYNVIRRPQLDPQRKKPLGEYVQLVKDDVQARPAHYFKRWNITFEENDLSRFQERQLQPAIRNFLDWYYAFAAYSDTKHPEVNDPWANPYHHRGTTESLSVGMMKSYLFNAITCNDYSGLYQRDVAHPELEN